MKHPNKVKSVLSAKLASLSRRITLKSAVKWTLILMLALPLLLTVFAEVGLAQSVSPTPTAGPPQQVRDLSDIAVRFVPAVKRVVEGAMLRLYTFLASVFAQISI